MNEKNILPRIKEYMELRHWTLYRLSKESDIPYTSLHSMFEKDTLPTIPTLIKLCHGLGITLSDFFLEDFSSDSMSCTSDEQNLLNQYRNLNKADRELLLILAKRFSKNIDDTE